MSDSTRPADLQPAPGKKPQSLLSPRPSLPPDMPPWQTAVVVFVVVAAAGVGAVLLLGGRGSDVQTTDSSTTAASPTTDPASGSTASTLEPSGSTTDTTAGSTTVSTDSTGTTATSVSTDTTATTVGSTTSSATAAPTVSPPVTTDPEPYRSAVWPWFDSTVRYDDPVAAARAFAEDYIGFDDPLVGEFLQGDSRSGEVEIRATEAGPTTVVFVRLLGTDDDWWVLGSATEHIVVDTPDALDRISSPLRVAGRALAFEGTVDLILRADGSMTPLIDDFVTGGGVEMGPFDSTFDYDVPQATGGALILLTESAEDGRVQSAAVMRVEFASP